MFKFIDLFSGIGGFRIALEKHGGKCVFSSEIDPHARETYFQNFNDMPSGDITEINSYDIPDHDILCAGFPCQPFSIAGYRKGFSDTRGTLFFEIEKILKAKQPKAFILENVVGIVSHDKGNTLRVIEDTLDKLDYTFSWKLLNAKDYGLPQNRNRWYCIGFKKELNIDYQDLNNSEFNEDSFNFPEKVELNVTLNDLIEKNVSSAYSMTERAKENMNLHLENYINSNRYNKNNVLIANEIRPSRCHFRSDGISPCLTAKMGTGGNNIPVVVSENRKLTERECLKIMGFPDKYKIENSYQSYKQIGNSVAIPIIQILTKEIVRLLYKAK